MILFANQWHRLFKRPYQLARLVDEGEGQPVILLHGIGRSGHVWEHVVRALRSDSSSRVVAFDLLGFGASPKPDWLQYTVDDHADSVIASIRRLGIKEPAVLAGHSMGCLVAVRVARRRPDLVKHLVLYEMPLYEGLPEKRSYRLRLDLYFRLYTRIVRYQPIFDRANAKLLDRVIMRAIGVHITQEIWQPFVKSLQNTIMTQTADDDIPLLSAPMDVIYGSRDMFVIGGKVQEIFGTDAKNITAHTIRASHAISPTAASFIASRIKDASHLENPVK